VSAYAFGFRAYPVSADLTLDQRGYVVTMLRCTAQSRAERLHTAAVRALDSAHTSSALAQAAEVALAEREWRRIVRACDREHRRLARLQPRPQLQGGAA
jgi:hypothetical protein